MKLGKSLINKTATHPIQTKQWGEFRVEWGNKVLYTNHGLLTIHKIPKTGYSIGMLLKGASPTVKMLEDLKKIGKEHKLIFIKLEPNTKKSDKDIKLLKSHGAVKGKTLFTPTTFWVDLTKNEEDLLKSFHSKTRYNIRLAKKRGVNVTEDNSPKAFEAYIKLMRRTVEHQKFYAHNEKYHRLMWKHLRKANIAHLLIAKQGEKIISAWILFKLNDFLYYPYGASDERYRNLMANNLMMWEAIRFGKKHKLKTFDLWGREPGKGFTKFKEGYSPEVVKFLGTWDLMINKNLYWSYRAADTARWAILRMRSRFIKPAF